MNKEKIKEYIAGGAFLWITFWAMATDSPGEAGLIGYEEGGNEQISV